MIEVLGEWYDLRLMMLIADLKLPQDRCASNARDSDTNLTSSHFRGEIFLPSHLLGLRLILYIPFIRLLLNPVRLP